MHTVSTIHLIFIFKFVISLLAAYAIGTYVEYIFHKLVGHPPMYVTRLVESFPKYFKQGIYEAHAGHDIHHKLTEVNFYNQFPKTLAHDQHINQYVKIFPNLESHNVSTKFGMSFDIFSISSAFMLTGPLSILTLFVFDRFFLWYIILPLPIIFITITSRYIHPLIHLPTSKLNEKRNWLVRLIIRSSYFKYVKRRHFLHHKSMGLFSYNLVPGFEQFLEGFRNVWSKVLK